MKLVSFLLNGKASWGIWRDDGIVDLGSDAYPTLKSALGTLAEATAHPTSAAIDPASVTLLVPVPDPGRILCVGLNYKRISPRRAASRRNIQ